MQTTTTFDVLASASGARSAEAAATAHAAPIELDLATLQHVAGGLLPRGTWGSAAMVEETDLPRATW